MWCILNRRLNEDAVLCLGPAAPFPKMLVLPSYGNRAWPLNYFIRWPISQMDLDGKPLQGEHTLPTWGAHFASRMKASAGSQQLEQGWLGASPNLGNLVVVLLWWRWWCGLGLLGLFSCRCFSDQRASWVRIAFVSVPFGRWWRSGCANRVQCGCPDWVKRSLFMVTAFPHGRYLFSEERKMTASALCL